MALENNSNLPLYERIQQYFEKKIYSGELAPGEKLPSISELQQTLNVSAGPIRQALKIMEAKNLISIRHGQGSFVNDFRSVNPKERLIGFICPKSEDDEMSFGWIRGIQSGLAAKGYSMVYAESDVLPSKEIREIERLKSLKVKGFIICPTGCPETVETMRDLHCSGCPVVFLDRTIPGLGVSSICSDNERGMQDLVEHLIQQGHENIGIAYEAREECTTSVQERLGGYKAALEDAGLEVKPELIYPLYGFETTWADEVVEKILNSDVRPSAVIGGNDHIALALLRKARERELNIPGDLAIAGFDDLSFSSFDEIGITTVKQDFYLMGQLAAQTIIREIENPHLAGTGSMRVPTRLVVRRSTTG